MITTVATASLAGAFAIEPGGEGKRTAARVKASILSGDWSWMHQDIELAKDVLSGLGKWCRSSGDIETLFSRVCVFNRARLSLPFDLDEWSATRDPWWYIAPWDELGSSVCLPSWGRADEAVAVLRVFHSTLASWQRRLKRIWSFQTDENPHRILIYDGFSDKWLLIDISGAVR